MVLAKLTKMRCETEKADNSTHVQSTGVRDNFQAAKHQDVGAQASLGGGSVGVPAGEDGEDEAAAAAAAAAALGGDGETDAGTQDLPDTPTGYALTNDAGWVADVEDAGTREAVTDDGGVDLIDGWDGSLGLEGHGGGQAQGANGVGRALLQVVGDEWDVEKGGGFGAGDDWQGRDGERLSETVGRGGSGWEAEESGLAGGEDGGSFELAAEGDWVGEDEAVLDAMFLVASVAEGLAAAVVHVLVFAVAIYGRPSLLLVRLGLVLCATLSYLEP